MKKKWMTGLLACLMLWSAAAAALPAQAAGSADPEFTLLVSNIEDKYVEVALVLNGGTSGRSFLNAGIAVEYNTKRLTPVDWAGTPYTDIKTSWGDATRLDTKGSDAVSGKTALLYEKGNSGHLYLSAEAVQTLIVPAGESVQAVTVRFVYRETFTAGNYGDVGYESDSDVAKASPALGVALYSAGMTNSSVVVDPKNPGGYFSYEENGNTAGGSSGNASDFHTVVFYDWDNTLLGSRIVADGGSLTGRGDAANQAPMPPEGNEILDSMGNKTGIVNKAGYTFAGWVDYNTGNTTKPGSLTDTGMLTVDRSTLVPLTGITKSLVLKAAYDETSIGATNASKRYTVNYSPFVTGNGGLQTTFTVARGATARRGNEGEMYLSVTLNPGGSGPTVFDVPLGKHDFEQYTITMPSNAYLTYQTAAISYRVYTKSKDNSIDYRSLSQTISVNEIINH